MSKYHKQIRPGVVVDVYDVLSAYNVTCPATAHAIKKLLMPGQRGAKDAVQDLREAIASIERAIELIDVVDVKGLTPDERARLRIKFSDDDAGVCA